VEELRAIWSKIGNTVLFITHNVREAVYLADRVVLLSFRPGRVREIFKIDLERPRDPDHPHLEAIVRDIVQQLHEEVEKSVAEEFRAP
jgi:NitT/TauT family transport system ATP-binding protein